MKILCTICGRGGSKEILNKNIKNFLGKPLIEHTISQAKNFRSFNKIVLSSDSKKILKIGEKCKLDLVLHRPKKLALDNTPKLVAIKHLHKASESFFNTKFDLIIDLDITAPLRSLTDIKKSINIIKKKKLPCNLVNISKSRRNPYFNMVRVQNKKVKLVNLSKKNVNSRQTAPIVYDVDPSIYAWNRSGLIKFGQILNKNTFYNITPNNRSMDIDSIEDFKFVEYLYRINKKGIKKN